MAENEDELVDYDEEEVRLIMDGRIGCNLLLLLEEALFYFFRYAGTMTRL